jgi:mannose-6-phosphate isomerase
MWIVVDAAPGAHLFTGLRRGVTREAFEQALKTGADISAMLRRHDVKAGDVMFLPSGRVHAIGAGNVIIEVQQNSDTTYRVFDFNRPGLDGRMRELHVPQSLASIDWDDFEPPLVTPDGEHLVHNEIFEVDRLVVDRERVVASDASCAVLIPVNGAVSCGDARFEPGQLFLVPAADGPSLPVASAADGPVTVLRAMLPSQP